MSGETAPRESRTWDLGVRVREAVGFGLEQAEAPAAMIVITAGIRRSWNDELWR